MTVRAGAGARSRMRMGHLLLSACWLAVGPSSIVAQDEAKPEPPKPPKALAVSPVILRIGEETQVRVRGDNLEAAEELRITPLGGGNAITLKPTEAKGGLPNIGKFSAKAAGVTMATLKTQIPGEWKPGEVEILVKTPGGVTEPLRARVVAPDRITKEKEPNNGFHQAQPQASILTGVINSENDVDVFRVDAHAGDTYRIDCFANRGGSLLDPYLTIYDNTGRLLEDIDDSAEHRDPIVEFTAETDGPVFVVIQDANRYGSDWHTWALSIELKPKS